MVLLGNRIEQGCHGLEEEGNESCYVMDKISVSQDLNILEICCTTMWIQLTKLSCTFKNSDDGTKLNRKLSRQFMFPRCKHLQMLLSKEQVHHCRLCLGCLQVKRITEMKVIWCVWLLKLCGDSGTRSHVTQSEVAVICSQRHY